MTNWLRRLFTSAEDLKPILIRARTAKGELASRVDVRVTWLPSRVHRTYTAATPQGMCLVPWYGDSATARLTIEADGQVGDLQVQARQTRFGRAFDIQLISLPSDGSLPPTS